MAGENKSFSRVSDVKMEVRDMSLPSPVFEIEVKATFIIMDGTPGVPNGMLAEAGRFISHVLYEFPLEALINDGDGQILDMLNSMRVPVQLSMVEEIASCAVRLATAARDNGRRVLRMKVEIDAVVDDVPFGNDDDTDDDTDDEGPATAEEMAQNVRKVVVEGPGMDCPICLEELAAGSEAACMRCSHVFHTPCIEAWLNMRKRCPCCRFMLSL